MLDSYIFIRNDELEKIDGCGMKLSDWADRSISINGEDKKFISSYLNPRDNISKYKSQDYKIVKLEVEMKYCYVAEGFLLADEYTSNKCLELYTQTIIPANEYIFGMYRKPECLIAKTILPDEMKVQEIGMLSFPLFYESSQALYLNKLLEGLREENKYFDDLVLSFYYNNLVLEGKAKKQKIENSNIAVFTLNNEKMPIVLAEQEVLVEG